MRIKRSNARHVTGPSDRLPSRNRARDAERILFFPSVGFRDRATRYVAPQHSAPGPSCLSHGRGDGTRFEQSESPFRRRANFPAGAGEHSPARPSIGSRHAGEGAACGRKRWLRWESWGTKPAGVPQPPRTQRVAFYAHAPTTPPRDLRRKPGWSDVARQMTFARQDAGAGTAGNFKANLRITWARPKGRAIGRSPRIERGALVRCPGESLERLRSRGVRPCSDAAVETLIAIASTLRRQAAAPFSWLSRKWCLRDLNTLRSNVSRRPRVHHALA